jgi:hypothetical protein
MTGNDDSTITTIGYGQQLDRRRGSVADQRIIAWNQEQSAAIGL